MSKLSGVWFVKATWSSRPADRHHCVSRLENYLHRLAGISSDFRTWYQTGRSRAAAMTPIEVDSSALGELIARGNARREDNGADIPELGATVSMWNGQTRGIKLLVSCGAFTTRVRNQVYLTLGNSSVGRSLDLSIAKELIIATAAVWQPDWAVIADSDIWQPVAGRSDGFGPGWVTYIADTTKTEGLDGVVERIRLGQLVTRTSDENGIVRMGGPDGGPAGM